MNYKHVAYIAGGAIVAISIAVAIAFMSSSPPPQGSDSIGSNVEMIGNGKNISQIHTENVEYTSGAAGFLAAPGIDGNYPGIVMIHEWWGLNENIKEMARQMAAEGYVVLAADLYNGQVAAESSQAQSLAGQVRNNPDTAVQNLRAAVSYLRNHESVDAGSVGSLGWCFGGGWSLQLALDAEQQLQATGIYYGSLVTDPERLSSIDSSVLGIFGSADTSIPVDQVKAFEAALNQNGIENEIYMYEGVGHAFANPSGANYAPEETMDAWEKTLAFFDRHLKESPA
jgi:carboxymethylenebutenolidase